MLAERLAITIARTQERKRRSRESATRARVRELAQLGINVRRLRSCQYGDLTL